MGNYGLNLGGLGAHTETSSSSFWRQDFQCFSKKKVLMCLCFHLLCCQNLKSGYLATVTILKFDWKWPNIEGHILWDPHTFYAAFIASWSWQLLQLEISHLWHFRGTTSYELIVLKKPQAHQRRDPKERVFLFIPRHTTTHKGRYILGMNQQRQDKGAFCPFYCNKKNMF